MSNTITSLNDTLTHRGPDDHAVWIDQENGIALGHRRLAIIDLSPNGRQPMISSSGRYVIVFNGEIYNFKELKKDLDKYAYQWRGQSDTEVMLAAIETYGVRKAVERFVGMFAFAVWDKSERVLHLVRDRLGIKPLYYGWCNNIFIFGSELKALKSHPEFDNPIDRNALALFFRFNYVPAPYSIYKNVWKLEPGEILILEAGSKDSSNGFNIKKEKYWSIHDIWMNGFYDPFHNDDKFLVNELDRLLKEAIKMRMISDVPLGAFLSGGIDSSTVVALMQAQSTRPVKTFSIGFNEQEYDEARYAKQIARYLGTDHIELFVSPEDLLKVIPDIPVYWDEPFGDSSQVPTFLLSRLVRNHVTVSLSGDGGDELFCGYQRYFWANQWKWINLIPYPIRNGAASILSALPEDLFRCLGQNGTRLHRRLESLKSDQFNLFYRFLISHFHTPSQVVPNSQEYMTCFTDERYKNKIPDLYHQMSFLDIISYLPDDILTKVDRASMASSLEVRVPLLDHRVVEFASRVPAKMKVRRGQGKWLLRELLKRYVPDELVERPKKGFSIPIKQWLQNDLRDWAETLLDEKNMKKDGYLDAAYIRRMWNAYLGGQSKWYYCIWDVLMFQAWLTCRN